MSAPTAAAPTSHTPSAHPKYVWWNGELVEWDKATVHVTEMEWVGVGSVFEGIKAYRNPEEDRAYVFRLPEHMRRFDESVRLLRQKNRWNETELSAAVVQLLRANGVKEDTYIRPFAYRGTRGYSFRGGASETDILINTHPFTSHMKTGRTISLGTSTWTRISDNTMPPRIKAVDNYHNRSLAGREVMANGYDDALILNDRGKVAESTGACIMMVKRGRVITPPVTHSVLESITRTTLLQLCEEQLNLSVEEREIDRTEVYMTDEVFLCGTGAEVNPVTAVDKYPIGDGKIGPVTQRIMDLYHDVVRGLDAPYDEWRTAV
jgi:branched-chain amino acid aminotransferase